MTLLSELYNDFFRIDLDARGGYARVADVVIRQEDGKHVHRAFKLMRHELDGRQVGMQRFENELMILVEISKDNNAPSAITRIYDSGFVEAELSQSLHKLHDGEKLNINPNLEIVSTGMDIQKFLDMKSALMDKEPDRWLPYLVVELAPYDDSLLRQIKAQSDGDFLNIYGLPVNTIVEMALQILDVIDYLHKKLRVAYIDWKPEHIYWNESSRQLKLIDWNVTTRLNGGQGDNQIIREDIRVFCGATLYCSLALTDPEALTRPIGTVPDLRKNKVPIIPPRYWTDKPNFYERDDILDEKIKQLVQKALDPNQGFNSLQELRNALIQYVEQLDEQGDRDLSTGLPHDAVQHYRRARSYIAARDFLYAISQLKLAIAAARAADMSYLGAEQLLKSVQDLLKADEFKKEVNPVLEKELWKDALDLYAKAVALNPTNELLKKEFDALQGLLSAESKLRKKSILKIFMSPSRLQTILEDAKDVIGSSNPLLNYVNKQSNQIRLMQTRLVQISLSSTITLLIGILALSFLTGRINFSEIFPITTDTPTNTPTNTASVTPLATSTSPSATVAVLATFTMSTTNTLEPSVTPIPVLGYAQLTQYIYPLEKPNGDYMGILLAARQEITVIERRDIKGLVWYKCSWKINGVVGEGWFLENYVQFESTPTPTPTP